MHYLRTLLARRVDGILVTGRASDKRPSIGRDLNVPMVYALAESDDPEDLSILPDDEGGAAIAVEHLIATGRRRIAVVSGPMGASASDHRVNGALKVLQRHGLEPVLGRALYGEWSERWGRDAAAILMRDSLDFDGVFCASDQVARGLLDGLREAGRRSPEEVGVIGVDNWSVMAEASRPTLTTVDLNLRDVGQLAARRLLEAIDGKPIPSGVELVPCELVTRQSTEFSVISPSAAVSPVASSGVVGEAR
jgi:LacI family transcriptional regulator